MKSIYSLLICICLLGMSIAYGDSLRCAYDIVSPGDSKVVVAMKCGKPHWRESLGSVTRGALRSGEEFIGSDVQTKGGRARDHDKGTTVYAEQTLVLEKWFYDCGSDAFIHAITFEGDLATKIESTSRRGTGNHTCEP